MPIKNATYQKIGTWIDMMLSFYQDEEMFETLLISMTG